jgi:hypothetical protein
MRGLVPFLADQRVGYAGEAGFRAIAFFILMLVFLR